MDEIDRLIDDAVERTRRDPELRYERLVAFAQWVVSLDDDDPQSQGRQDRRTVTLQQITERARQALGDMTLCSQCGEFPAVDYGMCPRCVHDALRSGWEPGKGSDVNR